MVDLKLIIFRGQIPNRNSEKTGIGRHEFRQACIGSKDGRDLRFKYQQNMTRGWSAGKWWWSWYEKEVLAKDATYDTDSTAGFDTFRAL